MIFVFILKLLFTIGRDAGEGIGKHDKCIADEGATNTNDGAVNFEQPITWFMSTVMPKLLKLQSSNSSDEPTTASRVDNGVDGAWKMPSPSSLSMKLERLGRFERGGQGFAVPCRYRLNWSLSKLGLWMAGYRSVNNIIITIYYFKNLYHKIHNQSINRDYKDLS